MNSFCENVMYFLFSTYYVNKNFNYNNNNLKSSLQNIYQNLVKVYEETGNILGNPLSDAEIELSITFFGDWEQDDSNLIESCLEYEFLNCYNDSMLESYYSYHKKQKNH